MTEMERYKQYIDSLGVPRDDIDRAYFHYRCRCVVESRSKRILKYPVWYALVIGAFFVYAVRALFKVKKVNCDAIFLDVIARETGHYNTKGVFPDELKQEFPGMITKEYAKYPGINTGRLSKRALKMWWQVVKRYPLCSKLVCMSFFHLMSAEEIIQIYNPKAVIEFRLENNIASCILSSFYESCGVEFINFQHGDYMLDIKRAFVRYSRCYVFNETYIKLFQWSGSPSEQFRVYTPPMYKNKFPVLEKYPFFATYYFSGPEGDIEAVARVLKNLTAKGYLCKVRCHPRYSNEELIKTTFADSGIEFENSREVPIEKSLSDTEYVIGRNSTVLTHGFFGGKKVVMDDLSYPGAYEDLKLRMNVMVTLPHVKLSEFEATIGD